MHKIRAILLAFCLVPLAGLLQNPPELESIHLSFSSASPDESLNCEVTENDVISCTIENLTASDLWIDVDCSFSITWMIERNDCSEFELQWDSTTSFSVSGIYGHVRLLANSEKGDSFQYDVELGESTDGHRFIAGRLMPPIESELTLVDSIDGFTQFNSTPDGRFIAPTLGEVGSSITIIGNQIGLNQSFQITDWFSWMGDVHHGEMPSEFSLTEVSQLASIPDESIGVVCGDSTPNLQITEWIELTNGCHWYHGYSNTTNPNTQQQVLQYRMDGVSIERMIDSDVSVFDLRRGGFGEHFQIVTELDEDDEVENVWLTEQFGIDAIASSKLRLSSMASPQTMESTLSGGSDEDEPSFRANRGAWCIHIKKGQTYAGTFAFHHNNRPILDWGALLAMPVLEDGEDDWALADWVPTYVPDTNEYPNREMEDGDWTIWVPDDWKIEDGQVKLTVMFQHSDWLPHHKVRLDMLITLDGNEDIDDGPEVKVDVNVNISPDNKFEAPLVRIGYQFIWDVDVSHSEGGEASENDYPILFSTEGILQDENEGVAAFEEIIEDTTEAITTYPERECREERLHGGGEEGATRQYVFIRDDAGSHNNEIATYVLIQNNPNDKSDAHYYFIVGDRIDKLQPLGEYGSLESHIINQELLRKQESGVITNGGNNLIIGVEEYQIQPEQFQFQTTWVTVDIEEERWIEDPSASCEVSDYSPIPLPTLTSFSVA